MSYTPEQLKQIAQAATILDQMDYYQALKIKPGAQPDEIKAAFFRQSQTWHPDRFYRRVPDETYRHVMKVYKRVSEAYSILRDDKLRPIYDKRISGPDRASQLRYDRSAEEVKARAKRDEDIAQTDGGKRYAKLAFQAINQRNLSSAEINFKLAVSMEPDNKELKLAHLRCKRDLKGKLSPEEELLLAEADG